MVFKSRIIALGVSARRRGFISAAGALVVVGRHGKASADGQLMRVIAGTLRGRVFDAPPGYTTRPMTDRIKEALFNILGARCAVPGRLPAFEVLDAFAGSGSLGIEALSRGARRCTFVERDRAALATLRRNLGSLGLASVSTVLPDNAWTMRRPIPVDGFGLVFVDPPYRDAEEPLRIWDLLERLAPSLSPDGLLVFRQETAAAMRLSELRGLRVVDERVYRRMRVALLERAHGESGSP